MLSSSFLNLAILSEEQNKSKNKSKLKPWIEIQEKHNKDIRANLLIPENIDLDFVNFIDFINKREDLITQKLKMNLK